MKNQFIFYIISWEQNTLQQQSTQPQYIHQNVPSDSQITMINQAIASQQQDQQRHQQQQQNLQQQQTLQQQNLQASQLTNNSSAALQNMNPAAVAAAATAAGSGSNQYQLPHLSLNIHSQLQPSIQMQPQYPNFAIKPVPLSSGLASTQHLSTNSTSNSSSNESSSQITPYLVQPSHNFQVINDEGDGKYYF